MLLAISQSDIRAPRCFMNQRVFSSFALFISLAFLNACVFDAPQNTRDASSSAADASSNSPDVNTRADAGIVDASTLDAAPNTDVLTLPDTGAPDAQSPDAQPTGPTPPYNYTLDCQIPQDPTTPGQLRAVPAFPNIEWSFLTMITTTPSAPQTLFVVERAGQIFSVQNDDTATERTLFLDIRDRVNPQGEGGLLGVAFHPDYQNNGHVFTNYTRSDNGQFKTRIARYTRGQNGTLDAASELTLLDIDQPFNNHNGGMIAFGPDGHLYIGMGDGGSGGDPLLHGQNTQTLHGAILRIDVDNPSANRPYGIPADNPFAQNTGDGRAEIFAWGVRNPWRFSFDSLTGDLWVADVGQTRREEVSVVSLGQNLGWKRMEGFRCFDPQQNCNDGSLSLPLFDYPRDVGESITGGIVYRGTQIPSLYGAYIFADYDLNRVFVFRPGEGPFNEEPIFSLDNIVSFAEDENGEILIVNLFGTIYRLDEVVDDPGNVPPFPQTLSETGCFTDLITMTPAQGVFEYAVAQPFWSDGAEKDRYFVLPQGTQLEWQEGRIDFPVGTIFIKTFNLQTDNNNAASSVKLETRFLVKDADRMRGYTYRWNEAQTEATLTQGAETQNIAMQNHDDVNVLEWRYLSRSQCNTCHNAASGGTLGAEGLQLEAAADYEGVGLSSSEALLRYELFSNALPNERAVHPALDDESASLESRARSYLHVNCSSCHLQDGPAGTDLNLDISASLSQMNACDEDPQKGTLGVAGAKLLAPGDADSSVLYLRTVQEVAAKRMPPLGTSRFDIVGSDVLRRWINSLNNCE